MTRASLDLFPDMRTYEMSRETRLLQNPLEDLLWPQIEMGLFKAMAVETCNVTMSELKARIGSGDLGVLITQDEADVVTGVAVLDADDQWVDMPFVWSAGLPSLNALISRTELIAKATGMRGVKWTTENDKAAAYAKKLGYKARLVEYVKEVT